jgi:CTP synthase (UTP-ammonia lyase)
MIRQDLGSYLLIISYHPSVETKLMDKISPLQATVQEMSEANSRRDMTLKLSAKNIDLELIDQLSEMDGVYQALIMHSNY